jgi:phage minor structural protein
VKHLIVYDKFTTNFDSLGEAVLEHAKEIEIFERLNGEYTLSFIFPKSDPKMECIVEDNYVKAEGQLFTINYLTEERDTEGLLMARVDCEHIYFELIEKHIPSLSIFNSTVQQILEGLLSGTRFTADAVRITGLYTFIHNKKSSLEGTVNLCKELDLELKRDNFTVALYEKIGNDNGVQFRYRKNLQNIKRVTDSRGVVTRLYAYGKDDISVVVDSPNINLYSVPREHSEQFDVETIEELQEKAEEFIQLHDKPKVSYGVNVLELKQLAEYGEHEAFALGDIVKVIDEDFGEVETRILEYRKGLKDPNKSSVMILANFMDGIEDDILALDKVKRIVDQVTYKEHINTFWLDGVIDTLKNQLKASGSYTSSEVLENKGFLLENNNEQSSDFGALYMGPGIFAIADEKVNGEWNWRSFGKGKGFTADEINTGILRASLVKIMADDSTFIDGGGFHVVDPDNIERVRLGQYEPGKYGLRLKSKDGNTTVLDEDGIIQTWQEGEEDNVDSTNPLVLDLYVPPEATSIYKAILRFRLKEFRAYSKGASSHSFSVFSSSTTAATTKTSSDGDWQLYSTLVPDVLSWEGSHSHGGSTGSAGGHNHGFTSGDKFTTEGGLTRTWSAIGDHSHSISSDGGHAHSIVSGHGHYVDIPGHDHSIDIPSHSHSIIYGIYKSTSATGVTVKINGTDRTTELGGSFTTDQDNLDISPYLASGWNTIELGSSQLGRISARAFLQCLLTT